MLNRVGIRVPIQQTFLRTFSVLFFGFFYIHLEAFETNKTYDWLKHTVCVTFKSGNSWREKNKQTVFLRMVDEYRPWNSCSQGNTATILKTAKLNDIVNM